jgi:hypothetical protein
MYIDAHQLIMVDIDSQKSYECCLTYTCFSHNNHWHFGFNSLNDQTHFKEVIEGNAIVIRWYNIVRVCDLRQHLKHAVCLKLTFEKT